MSCLELIDEPVLQINGATAELSTLSHDTSAFERSQNKRQLLLVSLLLINQLERFVTQVHALLRFRVHYLRCGL
jgi:hypothetical protein